MAYQAIFLDKSAHDMAIVGEKKLARGVQYIVSTPVADDLAL
jgi:hypothetical protein